MKTHVIVMLACGLAAPAAAAVWWPLSVPLIAAVLAAGWRAGE